MPLTRPFEATSPTRGEVKVLRIFQESHKRARSYRNFKFYLCFVPSNFQLTSHFSISMSLLEGLSFKRLTAGMRFSSLEDPGGVAPYALSHFQVFRNALRKSSQQLYPLGRLLIVRFCGPEGFLSNQPLVASSL